MKHNLQHDSTVMGFLSLIGNKSYHLYNLLYMFSKGLAYSWVLFLAAAVTGCEKEEAVPLESLQGKCLQGRVIAFDHCTYAVFVQLLNAKTGTISTYKGKEYKNVILISSLPKQNPKSPIDFSNTFYFTIDISKNFESCIEPNFACAYTSYADRLPSDVTLKACIKDFSSTECN
jgi:hypothetical protein